MPISRWTLVNPDQPVQIVGQDVEPTINFLTTDGFIILTLSSSKIEYNRTVFLSDTYQQAAKRVLDSFKRSLLYNFDISRSPATLKFNSYKEHSAKHFNIHADMIEHNYTLDTWHWWMLEELRDLIKREF